MKIKRFGRSSYPLIFFLNIEVIFLKKKMKLYKYIKPFYHGCQNQQVSLNSWNLLLKRWMASRELRNTEKNVAWGSLKVEEKNEGEGVKFV